MPRVLLLLAGVLAGLGLPDARAGLRVVTTVPVLYCLAANVAGNLATVENLLPPGADAHDFQFTIAERRKLDHADLILANGLALESWLEKALRNAGQTNVVRCAENLQDAWIRQSGGKPNPHVWLDPLLAARMVTNILAALQRADPSNGAAYAVNAAGYLARLHALDREFAVRLDTVSRRSIVTSHDAFPYLARRYRLTIVGVLEEQPEIDPSPAQLTALRAAIRQHHVGVLFADPNDRQGRLRQLASDFQVSLATLDTLEAAPLTPGSYEEAMRRNLETLARHLQ